MTSAIDSFVRNFNKMIPPDAFLTTESSIHVCIAIFYNSSLPVATAEFSIVNVAGVLSISPDKEIYLIITIYDD